MKRPVLHPMSTWVMLVLVVPLAMVLAGLLLLATTDVGELPFDNLSLIWLVAAAPVAGLIYLYGTHRRRRALNRFASASLVPMLAEGLSPIKPAIRAGLIVSAVFMITVGIIGPRWGIVLEEQQVYGVDVVVALDVSRSMYARDVEPNRFERAKREIRQQLVQRPAFHRMHRLALMAFAGSTSLRMPLSTDHITFETKLDQLYVGAAPRGGTDLGEAVYKATELFESSPEEASRILLLFTDGEDHEGHAAEAVAEALREHGIRTYCVGVGDPGAMGAEVPESGGPGAKPLVHDGQVVVSKLDVEGLRSIAKAGGGQYTAIADFRYLVDHVTDLENARLATEQREQYKARYQWFVAAALLLLTMETVITDRRRNVADLPQRVWQQEAA